MLCPLLGALLYVLDVVRSMQPSNPAATQLLLIEAAAAVDALPLFSSCEPVCWRNRGGCKFLLQQYHEVSQVRLS
jgi:hypothetical protein